MVSRAVYGASVGIAAGWVAALVVLAAVSPGSASAPWAFGQSRSFNLTASYPTGNASYNGQLGCGPNITKTVTFPAPGIMSFNITQAQYGASVNIWIFGAGGFSFMNSGGGPGGSWGWMEYANGTFHFGFIACGPTPTVTLGFWGIVTYWSGEPRVGGPPP